jgi:thiamine transporter ThiT
MEPTFSVGFVLGIMGGFLFGMFALEKFYRPVYKKMLDEVVNQYIIILHNFGISKNKDGRWQMTSKDLNEIWVKK